MPQDAKRMFTERAEAALRAAHQEATRGDPGVVTTGDAVIGLAASGAGTGYELVRAARITPEAARQRVGGAPASMDATPGAGGLSRGLELALERAHREARMEGCSRIGSEHLLLGLIDTVDTQASALLNQCGLNLMYFRQYLDQARELSRATSAPGAVRRGGLSVPGSASDAVTAALSVCVPPAKASPAPTRPRPPVPEPAKPSPPPAAAPSAAPKSEPQPAQRPAQAAAPSTTSPPKAPEVAKAADSGSDLLARIMASNKDFVRAMRRDELVGRHPALGLAVITCMDCRLTDWFMRAMGLQRGDAVVMRNAGAWPAGRDDVVRSLAVAVYLQGVREVIVLGHTDCAMCSFSASEFTDALSRAGVGRAAIDSPDLRGWVGAAAPDVDAHVRRTVQDLRAAAVLPHSLAVHGLCLDTNTGEIRRVT